MKNLSVALVTSLMLLLLTGCDKEDDNAPVKGYVINRKISSDALGNWVFFSDKNGKPLKTYTLTEQYQVINYDFSNETPYWVTVVRQWTNKAVDLRTLQLVEEIDTIDFQYIGSPYTNSVSFNLSSGDAVVDVSQLTGARDITVGSDGYASFIYADYHRYNHFKLSKVNGENCYISLVDHYGEPKYMLVNGVLKGDTLIPEQNDFKEYDRGFDFENGAYIYSRGKVTGIIDDTENYCIFYSTTAEGMGSQPVRYLDTFGKYETYLTYYRNEVNQDLKEVYYQEFSNEPLSSHTVVDNNIFLNIVEDGKISYQYSGDAIISSWTWDTFEVDYVGDDPFINHFWWLDTDINNTTFIRPSVPEDIMRQLGVDMEFRLTSASFESYSFLNSYSDHMLFNASNESYPDQFRRVNEVLSNYEGLGK